MSFLNFFFHRQENLFVNLIRKILVKDFKDCDSFADVSFNYDQTENIHNRTCHNEPTAPIPTNCILSSIFKAQLLVKNNFAKLEALEGLEKLIDCDVNIQKILQDYKIGSTALDCSIMLTLRKFNGNFDSRWDLLVFWELNIWNFFQRFSEFF